MGADDSRRLPVSWCWQLGHCFLSQLRSSTLAASLLPRFTVCFLVTLYNLWGWRCYCIGALFRLLSVCRVPRCVLWLNAKRCKVGSISAYRVKISKNRNVGSTFQLVPLLTAWAHHNPPNFVVIFGDFLHFWEALCSNTSSMQMMYFVFLQWEG